PATRFVASFIGTMNVLEGRMVERRTDGLLIAAGALMVVTQADAAAPAPGSALAVGIRPEDVLIEPAGTPATTAVRLVGTVFHGRTLRLHTRLADGTDL